MILNKKNNIFMILGVFLLSLNLFSSDKHETAIFAGGCFWCMEPPFEKLKGVQAVTAGYVGASKVEVIKIIYDPTKITYKELLDVFWQNIDPTDAGGQFVDRGLNYQTVVYYLNESQKKIAINSKEELTSSGKFKEPIVTQILESPIFNEAETYHQDFYKTNPIRYKTYRRGSGRDVFLTKMWGKYMRLSEEDLKKKLTHTQYKVTQKGGTEKPFSNEYWNNEKVGIYVDIVSGEPLFSSKDKFKSGTGWPSFSKPLEKINIIEKEDNSFFSKRTEVRSKHADSHLGHVFDDGPEPTGKRYCINSASLRFIPKEKLEEEGYGEYKKLFEK